MIVNMLLSVPARFYALPKLGCKDTGTKDTVPDALTFNTKFTTLFYSRCQSDMAATSSGVYDFYADNSNADLWKGLLQPALRKVS